MIYVEIKNSYWIGNEKKDLEVHLNFCARRLILISHLYFEMAKTRHSIKIFKATVGKQYIVGIVIEMFLNIIWSEIVCLVFKQFEEKSVSLLCFSGWNKDFCNLLKLHILIKNWFLFECNLWAIAWSTVRALARAEGNNSARLFTPR